jgi:hypothetical protein
MHEQRLTIRLTGIWDKLAECAPPPAFAQFNIASISDIWQQCCVLKINPSEVSNNISFNIEFIGDNVKKLLPDFRIGSRFSVKNMSMQAKKYLNQLTMVVNEQVTLINQGTVVGANNKIIKYRVCLLPFSDKNAKIAYIIVGFSWLEC